MSRLYKSGLILIALADIFTLVYYLLCKTFTLFRFRLRGTADTIGTYLKEYKKKVFKKKKVTATMTAVVNGTKEEIMFSPLNF